jgi:hypothetical protein
MNVNVLKYLSNWTFYFRGIEIRDEVEVARSKNIKFRIIFNFSVKRKHPGALYSAREHKLEGKAQSS